jgi:drug/metabolite transporter (DMT)-like permease
MKFSRHSGGLAAAGTVLLWVSAFPAISVAVVGLGPAGLSVARLAIASVCVGLAAPFLGVRRPRARDLPLIALCGQATISLYLVPAAAIVISLVSLSQIPGIIELAGGALALAGVILASTRPRHGPRQPGPGRSAAVSGTHQAG